jgi:hypothetical protein
MDLICAAGFPSLPLQTLPIISLPRFQREALAPSIHSVFNTSANLCFYPLQVERSEGRQGVDPFRPIEIIQPLRARDIPRKAEDAYSTRERVGEYPEGPMVRATGM